MTGPTKLTQVVSRHDVRRWHQDAYPDATLERVAIKLGEEAGEVLRAIDRLLTLRGRGDVDELAAMVEAVRVGDVAVELGDLVIVATRLADLLGLDLHDAAIDRWLEVRQRSGPSAARSDEPDGEGQEHRRAAANGTGPQDVPARTCSSCGCTDVESCDTAAGPRWWVDWDLCSACDTEEPLPPVPLPGHGRSGRRGSL